MPTRRLRLGGMQRSDAKAVAMRLPDGLADVSPGRLRFETDPAASEIALRIDRVSSPWTLDRLEQELLQTRTFERLPVTGKESRVTRAGSATMLSGHATAGVTTGTDAETGVVYAILDLGREKLVARFVGSRDQLAFNEGVLRESLASLEAEPLIRDARTARADGMVADTLPAKRSLRFPCLSVGSSRPAVQPRARDCRGQRRRAAPCPARFHRGAARGHLAGDHRTGRGERGVLAVARFARERVLCVALRAAGHGLLGGGCLSSQRATGVAVRGHRPTQQSAYARALLALWVRQATN